MSEIELQNNVNKNKVKILENNCSFTKQFVENCCEIYYNSEMIFKDKFSSLKLF